jgi:hypothetical protein
MPQEPCSPGCYAAGNDYNSSASDPHRIRLKTTVKVSMPMAKNGTNLDKKQKRKKLL